MIREWFNTSEISKIDGMPNSSFAVSRKAKAENWLSRAKEDGKGFEYHISNFPEPIAKQLIRNWLDDTPAGRAANKIQAEERQLEEQERKKVTQETTKNLVKFNALKQEQQDIAFAKYDVVKAREKFLKPYAESKRIMVGHKEFIAAFEEQTLELDQKVYGLVKRVSKSTVDKWQRTYKEKGLFGLARKPSQRRGDCIISSQPDLEQFCIVLLIDKPHFKNQASKLRENAIIQAKKLEEDWKIPAVSSFRRWVQHWVANNTGKFTFATDHTKYYGKERGRISDHEAWVSAPNDMWELDSTPTDVMLNVNNKLTRYSIVACIDVYTKRVKMLLSPSSTSEAIALLMRKVILDWGLLNNDGLIRTDNGSDYIAKRTTAIFEHLGATQSRAEAFSGWQKPFIERFFGTFQGGIVETLPTYIGHNVSDREKIEACHAFADRIGAGRKKRYEDALELAMTPEEFQTFMDEWLEHCYNHKAHSGNDGLSPMEMYMVADYKPRYVTNERPLDMLLNFVGEASVRRGGVQINKLVYRAPELQEERWMRQRVNVFLDPTDVAKAYIYPLDSFEECVEAVNADLIGREITPEEYTQKRRTEEKKLRDFKRDMKRYSEEFGINDLAAEAIAQAKARNNLSMLPKPGVEHGNTALSALEKAGLAKDGNWSQAELEAIKRGREQRAEAQQKAAETNARGLKNEQTVAWEFADILVNGGELTPQQEKWFDDYLRTHQLTAPKIRKYIESGGKTRRMG